MVNESLEVCSSVWSRERAKTRCEYPHMEVCYREPRLERRREMTLYRFRRSTKHPSARGETREEDGLAYLWPKTHCPPLRDQHRVVRTTPTRDVQQSALNCHTQAHQIP